MEVSQRLRELRKGAKQTQDRMARVLGITLRQYQRIESGSARPSYACLEALADYYHVSVDYLMCRTDFPMVMDEQIVEIYSPEEMAMIQRYREEKERNGQ